MTNKDLAAINREKTTKKVLETLNMLKKRKKTISINTLSKEAGISRQTLYNRPDLKAKLDEVNSLIQDGLNAKQPNKKTHRLTVQEKRIQRLQNELDESKEENIKLLDQNSILTETILKLQRKIADLEERLYKDTVIELVKR
jgi:lambda repressor-like predicted transcriptional regulator